MTDLHPEHARTILADLSIGVVMLDALERVTWLNEHAARLLDAPVEALLGRDAGTLPLPYAPPGDGGVDAAVSVHGRLIGFTQVFRHAAGATATIMLYERGHALVSFLEVLAGGLGGASVSGPLSRAGIRSRLDTEVSRSRRYANPLSCVTVRLTTELEEMAMPGVARVLKEQLRWVDVLGRWDDDVLLVVLPESDDPDAAALGGKLLDALNRSSMLGDVGVEVGRATWRRGDSAERLVRRALAVGRGQAPRRSESRRRG